MDCSVARFPGPFTYPENQAVTILSFLESGQHHVLWPHGHIRMFCTQPARVRFHLHRLEHKVVFVAVPHGQRLPPVAAMRISSVAEVMPPAVGIPVRPGWRAQQRDAQHIVLAVIPTLRLIQQAETMLSIALVGPAQRRDFKLRLLPALVARGRSLNAGISFAWHQHRRARRGQMLRRLNLGHHSAQCTICAHPNCDEIEQMWIDWVHPEHIACVFHVSRDAQCRHAHALGLLERRSKNIRRALERIIEQGGAASPSISGVVSAVKAYVKFTSAGQGAEPAQGVDPKEIIECMSQAERDAFARDVSLPEWFSSATNATPGEGQEEGKEGPITEANRLQ